MALIIYRLVNIGLSSSNTPSTEVDAIKTLTFLQIVTELRKLREAMESIESGGAIDLIDV